MPTLHQPLAAQMEMAPLQQSKPPHSAAAHSADAAPADTMPRPKWKLDSAVEASPCDSSRSLLSDSDTTASAANRSALLLPLVRSPSTDVSDGEWATELGDSSSATAFSLTDSSEEPDGDFGCTSVGPGRVIAGPPAEPDWLQALLLSDTSPDDDDTDVIEFQPALVWPSASFAADAATDLEPLTPSWVGPKPQLSITLPPATAAEALIGAPVAVSVFAEFAPVSQSRPLIGVARLHPSPLPPAPSHLPPFISAHSFTPPPAAAFCNSVSSRQLLPLQPPLCPAAPIPAACAAAAPQLTSRPPQHSGNPALIRHAPLQGASVGADSLSLQPLLRLGQSPKPMLAAEAACTESGPAASAAALVLGNSSAPRSIPTIAPSQILAATAVATAVRRPRPIPSAFRFTASEILSWGGPIELPLPLLVAALEAQADLCGELTGAAAFDPSALLDLLSQLELSLWLGRTAPAIDNLLERQREETVSSASGVVGGGNPLLLPTSAYRRQLNLVHSLTKLAPVLLKIALQLKVACERPVERGPGSRAASLLQQPDLTSAHECIDLTLRSLLGLTSYPVLRALAVGLLGAARPSSSISISGLRTLQHSVDDETAALFTSAHDTMHALNAFSVVAELIDMMMLRDSDENVAGAQRRADGARKASAGGHGAAPPDAARARQPPLAGVPPCVCGTASGLAAFATANLHARTVDLLRRHQSDAGLCLPLAEVLAAVLTAGAEILRGAAARTEEEASRTKVDSEPKPLQSRYPVRNSQLTALRSLHAHASRNAAPLLYAILRRHCDTVAAPNQTPSYETAGGSTTGLPTSQQRRPVVGLGSPALRLQAACCRALRAVREVEALKPTQARQPDD